jgi:hypothetical protein
MVTVYAASRQGGRLLADEEAKVALVPRPTMVGTQVPAAEPSQAGPAAGAQRTTDVAEAVQPAKLAPTMPQARPPAPTRRLSAKTGRAISKKAAVPGRKPAVVAERRATPKSSAKTAGARRGPVAPRAAFTKTGRNRPPIEIAGR